MRDVATEAAAVKQGRADHAILLPICTRVLAIKVVQLTATRTSIVKGLTSMSSSWTSKVAFALGPVAVV